jgi:hypothetical protein
MTPRVVILLGEEIWDENEGRIFIRMEKKGFEGLTM